VDRHAKQGYPSQPRQPLCVYHTKLNWLTQLLACAAEVRSSFEVKTVSRVSAPSSTPANAIGGQDENGSPKKINRPGSGPIPPSGARFCGRPAPRRWRRLRECRGGLYNCGVMDNTFRRTPKGGEPAHLSASRRSDRREPKADRSAGAQLNFER